MLDHLEPYRRAESPYSHALSRTDELDTKLERFAATPRSVSRAIEKSIVSRRPRARYVAPWINSFGPWFRSLLPTRLIDWVFRVAAGLRRPPARALPSGA